MKRSEDGKHIVVRLSEQDGKRGTLKFPKPVKGLKMLEGVLFESDKIEYKPFEILTIGI